MRNNMKKSNTSKVLDFCFFLVIPVNHPSLSFQRMQESVPIHIFTNFPTLSPILTKYIPGTKPETSILTLSPP